jgi:hypothetical protein
MMALIAECPECGATRKYKEGLHWAKKNKRCKNCAAINCYAFRTEYPYGIDNWDILTTYTWRSDWNITPVKWNWLKFKWEKIQCPSN